MYIESIENNFLKNKLILYFTIHFKAVCRLGGQIMYQECQDLKRKILDQSNKEIILEIKQSLEEIKEVRTELRELQNSHSTLHTEYSNVTANLKELQESHSTLQTEHLKVTEILEDPIPRISRGMVYLLKPVNLQYELTG